MEISTEFSSNSKILSILSEENFASFRAFGNYINLYDDNNIYKILIHTSKDLPNTEDFILKVHWLQLKYYIDISLTVYFIFLK